MLSIFCQENSCSVGFHSNKTGITPLCFPRQSGHDPQGGKHCGNKSGTVFSGLALRMQPVIPSLGSQRQGHGEFTVILQNRVWAQLVLYDSVPKFIIKKNDCVFFKSRSLSSSPATTQQCCAVFFFFRFLPGIPKNKTKNPQNPPSHHSSLVSPKMFICSLKVPTRALTTSKLCMVSPEQIPSG